MFVLLPSPLLGPATWEPVSRHLLARGHRVEIASWGGPTPDVDTVRDAVLAVGDGHSDLVLVPHSGAGLLAGHLADLVGAVATVHVDAALPPVVERGLADLLDEGDGGPAQRPGPVEVPLAPPDLLERLRDRVGPDGLLPPWTQWWDDLDGVFPDAAALALVEAEQPRLPLAWLEQRVPVQEGWADRACAYLAFGTTYAEELALAERQGWPVTRLEGGHLHQLHDPAGVAEAVVDLAERAGRD